jgi:hypothetical protein
MLSGTGSHQYDQTKTVRATSLTIDWRKPVGLFVTGFPVSTGTLEQIGLLFALATGFLDRVRY